MKEVVFMKYFIIFVAILAIILVTVSLLLDELMGIFIVCIIVSLLLNVYDKEKDHKRLK